MANEGKTNLRGADAEVLQIVALQSGDPERIRGVLDPRNPLPGSILPHVIPLLDVCGVAGAAMHALQQVADRHPGALIDALLNPTQVPTVRRRIARTLSACGSQLVADGLLLALDDPSADVRIQCARSLFRISRRYPEVRFDPARMLDLVRAEVDRDTFDLAHVFTLLSFVVPVKPLRAAYRGLRGPDPHVRGTAIEYLHNVLPRDIGGAILRKLEDGT